MAGTARMNAAASSVKPPRLKLEEKGEAVDPAFGVEPLFGLAGSSSEAAPASRPAALVGVDADAAERPPAARGALVGA